MENCTSVTGNMKHVCGRGPAYRNLDLLFDCYQRDNFASLLEKLAASAEQQLRQRFWPLGVAFMITCDQFRVASSIFEDRYLTLMHCIFHDNITHYLHMRDLHLQKKEDDIARRQRIGPEVRTGPFPVPPQLRFAADHVCEHVCTCVWCCREHDCDHFLAKECSKRQ